MCRDASSQLAILVCLLFCPTIPTCFFNLFNCFLYLFVLFFSRAELQQVYKTVSVVGSIAAEAWGGLKLQYRGHENIAAFPTLVVTLLQSRGQVSMCRSIDIRRGKGTGNVHILHAVKCVSCPVWFNSIV